MAETVEGGRYLSTDGVTLHDAHGKVLGQDAKRPNEGHPRPPVTVETVVEQPLRTTETVEIKPASEVDLSVGVPRGKART